MKEAKFSTRGGGWFIKGKKSMTHDKKHQDYFREWEYVVVT